VGDPGKPPGEAGPSPPASPPANGPKALQLGGGVPVGFLAPAGLHYGSDGGLIPIGDRPAEGEQDAGARGGGQRRYLYWLGDLAVVAWCGQGQQWRLLGLAQGLAAGLPQLNLRWGANDAFGDIDRLGRAQGRGPQRAGLLLHLCGHRRLED
jgi:hypothetical protein